MFLKRLTSPGPSLIAWCGALVAVLLMIPALADTLRGPERSRGGTVRSLPARDIAARAAAGGRIVFVDVREPEEFDEFHIPGAVNRPLRELAGGGLDDLRDADLVVPYCLKDFRGFEGARILIRAGVGNVATMDQFGIKAWVREGLPLAGTRAGQTDAEAAERLRAMMREVVP